MRCQPPSPQRSNSSVHCVCERKLSSASSPTRIISANLSARKSVRSIAFNRGILPETATHASAFSDMVAQLDLDQLPLTCITFIILPTHLSVVGFPSGAGRYPNLNLNLIFATADFRLSQDTGVWR